MSRLDDSIEKNPATLSSEVASHSDSDGTYNTTALSTEHEPHTKNIFRRMARSFKPPEDNHLYDHMDPREKAVMYLSRSQPKLSRRHLMIIAASSCVGTGLFIGSGSSLKTGGPAALVLAFGIMGLNMICTMSSAGELSLRYPSISPMYTMNARFLHPSVGFGIGWIYFFVWLVTVPLELIAAAELTQFWHDDNNAAAKANPVAWVAILYVFNIIISFSGSLVYGELEFFVGAIKVCAMIGFILFSMIEVCGGPPTNHYIGAHNFHNPKPFMSGFKGLVTAVVSCSFALGGTEVSGIAAAETANPIRSIPSAVRQAFWRILVFFVIGILFVSLMVPPTTKGLGNSSTGTGSPFIAALSLTGVKALPSIFNAVIICSVIGVSNAAIYACSRTLVALSIDGAAPHHFCYLDRKGRPINALLVVLVFAAICFVAASDKHDEVFNWLYAFAALGFLFAWSGINLSHLRFRWAMKSQGRSLKELLYTSPLGVPGSITGAVISLGTLGLQFWIYLFPVGVKTPSASYFFQGDLSVPILIAIVIIHKCFYWKTAKFSTNKELDLDAGIREIDYEELHRINEEQTISEKKNPVLKLGRWLC